MDTQIKTIMIALELSQNSVEKASGIPHTTFSKAYSGVTEVDNLYFFTALKIARALGVKPEELLSDESREELRKVRKARKRVRARSEKATKE